MIGRGIMLAMAVLATDVQAQNLNPITAASLSPPTNSIAVVTSTNTTSVIGDLKQAAADGWAALKDLNFGQGIVVEPFGLYHKGDIGGGLAVTTGNTNGLNAGFALATIHDSASKRFQFYDATLNISLGKTVTVPLLNIPAYLYVETGPSVNLAHPSTVLEQSIAGVKIFLDKGKISLGGGVGHNSEWSGDTFLIAHFSYKF